MIYFINKKKIKTHNINWEDTCMNEKFLTKYTQYIYMDKKNYDKRINFDLFMSKINS